MSAWPEAVWLSKKVKGSINEALNIITLVEENNEKVEPLNDKLDTVAAEVARAKTDINNAQSDVAAANARFDTIQQELSDLENDLNNATDGLQPQIDQVNANIADLQNSIDKQLVVIAKNANEGTDDPPFPIGYGNNVSKNSIFLIVYD